MLAEASTQILDYYRLDHFQKEQ